LFPLYAHSIFRAMPDKSIPERLDDCEKFEADLQSELVKHSSTLDDLKKRIESQEEAMKQFQSDLRKDFQALIQLRCL